MSDLNVPRGDKGFQLNFTVQDSDGVAYTLTGYTIKLKVWRLNDPGNLHLSGTCTILVAASGTCYYSVVDGDFNVADDYLAELELSKTDTIESTERFTLSVRESG